MTTTAEDSPAKALKLLVGKWRMQLGAEDEVSRDAEGHVTFEWLSEGQFLIQRWEVSLSEAPDGLAVIGSDPESAGNYLQHYFDTRGVARVYKMSLTDSVWKLWRDEADFSPLDFRQRYTGTIEDDGSTITGAWEICHDGQTWEHDFDLSYIKEA